MLGRQMYIPAQAAAEADDKVVDTGSAAALHNGPSRMVPVAELVLEDIEFLRALLEQIPQVEESCRHMCVLAHAAAAAELLIVDTRCAASVDNDPVRRAPVAELVLADLGFVFVTPKWVRSLALVARPADKSALSTTPGAELV